MRKRCSAAKSPTLVVTQLPAQVRLIPGESILLSLSTNLGDTKTLCAHPASTSHGKLSEAQRQAAGINQGLIRVAVGLEHLQDVQDDLARGLNTLDSL